MQTANSKKRITILAIDTSCDETSAAVTADDLAKNTAAHSIII
ncbi:MAG TPA: hypothetical protein VJL83_05705 [Patescibacteria group bacterium]|nr:hypothetical protein [Patescibacteria group bacterium]